MGKLSAVLTPEDVRTMTPELAEARAAQRRRPAPETPQQHEGLRTITVPESLRTTWRVPRQITVHAHGLTQPSHMEWTLDGRLLVSEFGMGRVVDITAGGNMRGAVPWAWGLNHPAGLVTTWEGGRILVNDTGRRAIYDITEGGPIDKAPVIFRNIPGPYGLLLYYGMLLSTYSTDVENGLVFVHEGQEFTWEAVRIGGFPNGVREAPYFLTENQHEGDCGCWTALGIEERLYYLHSGLGQIFDCEHDTKYSAQLPILARGLQLPLGMILHPHQQLLYVAERKNGAIKVVPLDTMGTDMRYIPPVATGFKEPSCLRFSADGEQMYVCDMAGCCVWRLDF